MTSIGHEGGFTPAARFLLICAAFVVVVAGLKAASALVTPFLLAVFIAVLAAEPLTYLRRRGLPNWAAMLVTIGLVAGVGLVIVALVTTSINEFNANLPGYQARLKGISDDLAVWLDGIGVQISRDTLNSLVDPARVLGIAGDLVRGLGGVLTNALMILLTVVFILLEARGMPNKLRLALQAPESSLAHLRQVVFTIVRYMAIKASTSLATGVMIWVWLGFLRVDFAVLWAMLAFLLNFVPTIGSIIAAVPAVLLALVQLDLNAALLVAGGYLFVNIFIGNIVEPKVMGQGLGLSTLVVFSSLVFWGFVLGTAGMFLSVPLTMAIKIALGGHPNTRPIAILLSPATEAGQVAAPAASILPDGRPAPSASERTS
ncbi:MAG: AI-2E family transporter [Chromatiaceae bacterium]|nr:MAG: AI-2E family transporter [Chromatiaceae bacterium]